MGKSGVTRERVLAWLLSQEVTPTKAKLLGITSKQEKNASRNYEICFECNRLGYLYVDSDGLVILDVKRHIGKKNMLKPGAAWHTNKGGVFYIVSEMMGLSDDEKKPLNYKKLSPRSVRSIYELEENIQHRKYTKNISD